jgi:hypothetical protein
MLKMPSISRFNSRRVRVEGTKRRGNDGRVGRRKGKYSRFSV